MPRLLTHRTVSVSPDDPAIVIDSVPPLPTHYGPVIAQALTNIIATDTGVIYISCAQDFAHLGVTIDIWDHTPTDDPTNNGWQRFPTLGVDWPTNELVISDTVEPHPRSGELELPHPGHYIVDAYHRGRHRAYTHAEDLRHQILAHKMSRDALHAAIRQFDNVEQYLIRMWPHEPA